MSLASDLKECSGSRAKWSCVESTSVDSISNQELVDAVVAEGLATRSSVSGYNKKTLRNILLVEYSKMCFF